MTISRTTFSAKVGHWFKRYAPLEGAGTIGALAGAWLAIALSAPTAVMVLAATLGENLGYYGLAGLREWRRLRRALGPRSRTPRSIAAPGMQSLRGLLLEFGPAELLDSLWIRPGLMYLASQSIHNVAASVLMGKLLADLFFYALTIAGYEMDRRRRTAVPLHEVNPS